MKGKDTCFDVHQNGAMIHCRYLFLKYIHVDKGCYPLTLI